MKTLNGKAKLVLTLCIAFIILMPIAQTSYAQGRKLKKAEKRQYKKKMKFYKKEGYTISGTTRTLEVALLTHYDKLKDENNQELTITTEGCPTINLCDRKALTDAATKYAQQAASFVRGRVDSEQGYDAANVDNEAATKDRFYAAYELLVSGNVSKVLYKSFAVQKKKKKGAYAYEAYYVINEDKARKARIEAAKQALEETKANVEWGETIGDFINQGFDVNNTAQPPSGS